MRRSIRAAVLAAALAHTALLQGFHGRGAVAPDDRRDLVKLLVVDRAGNIVGPGRLLLASRK